MRFTGSSIGIGVISRALGLWMVIVGVVATPVFGQTFPLRNNASNRYLEDQAGQPFFLNAESMWSLLVQCKYDSANKYLLDRQARGVNTILCQLPTHGYASGFSNNVNGHSPFTGTLWITPREAFFAHADSIINRATALGFSIMLDVSYLGWDTNEGWINEITAASTANMKTWGVFLGNRYKNNPNITWVMGGDHDPSGVRSKIDSLVAGIKSADVVYSANRLFTGHPDDTYSARNRFSSWVNFNFWYNNQWPDFGSPMGTADERIWQGADQNYDQNPVMPFFLGEGMYEHEHSVTQLSLRKQMYWPILRGACGQLYGNNPLWGMGFNWNSGGTNWSAELTSGGSLSEQYMAALFRSRNWYKLIPDRNSTTMTAGALSGATFATTAYASDSSSIIAYLPTQRSVTINPAKLKGDSIRVWWYNPSNSAVTDMGLFSKISRSYTQPSSGDWVMIIDGKGFNFSQPGNLGPTLASPANGSTSIATNPTLTWNAWTGAISYRVQVSTNAGFGTTVVDQSNVTTTSFAASGLVANTLYYWRVNATYSGGTSAYSTGWSFTTVAPPPPIPLSPVLAAPANGSTGVAMNPTLTWNASSGATSYRVQVSTVPGFTTTVVDQSNITTTFLAASSLVTNALYYWRVSATNSGGTSAFSAAFNFTTAGTPTTVAMYQNAALSSPWNDIRSYSVTRTYNNTTPVNEGASSLRLAYSAWGSLQFSQGSWSSFVSLNPAQYQSLDFAIHGGTSGATLYVRCLSSSGSSLTAVAVTVPANTWQLKSIPMSQLATSSFVAIEFAATVAVTCYLDNVALALTGTTMPPPPALATPASGSTGIATNPTLTWNASTGAVSYRLRVSTDSGFATTVVDQSNVTATSFAPSGLGTNTLYYWHVNATNSGGTSEYSTDWSLTTVVSSPPPPPVLATPANGSTGVAVSPTLTWNASTGATSYRVQVSTVPGFTTTVVDQSNITTTFLAASSLVTNALYYWRVSATNSGGTSTFSAAFNFTTVETPTTVAVYQNAALSSPWNDIRSYSVTRTYNNTTPVNEGASSLRLAYSAWGSLQFSQGSWSSFVSLNPAQYQSLDFAIHGGTSGATLYIRCLNASGGPLKSAVVVTVPANTWQLKSIPMSQLATSSFVAIELFAAVSVTCYLDNIGLAVASLPTILAVKVETQDEAVEAKWKEVANVSTNDEIEELVKAYGRSDSASHITTLRVSAIGGGSLAYQWQRDGADISGASSDLYTLSDGDTAGVRCIVSNLFGADTSREVIVSHSSSLINSSVPNIGRVVADEQPLQYSLEQNYPNPFNPSTTIKYDLPNASQVTLKLFNTLGQEVATLVNEGQKAGYKSVEWNASGFASGMYFYRLQAGDFVQTRKLLLLR